jgi:hypothetical protein
MSLLARLGKVTHVHGLVVPSQDALRRTVNWQGRA